MNIFTHSLQEVLGRLLGMLFQWFDATAYLPDGELSVCKNFEFLCPGIDRSGAYSFRPVHLSVLLLVCSVCPFICP